MEDLESLLQGWVETRHETISMQEIFRQIQEDQHAVEALRAWMDAQYA
jgi:L-fucose isomerase-like protein